MPSALRTAMQTDLSALTEAASKKAKESGQIQDLERAVSAIKLAAETEKLLEDARNQRRTLRYEAVKSWATLLVPALTVGTLAVTIYIQQAQLRATIDANEDTQWRDMLKQFSGDRAEVVPGPAAQASLGPILKSERYGKHARHLASGLLSRVADQDVFQDLFDSVFDGPSIGDLEQMANVSRQLDATYSEVVVKKPKVKDTVSKTTRSRAAIDTWEKQTNLLRTEISFVCSKIGQILRMPRAKELKIDLKSVLLNSCDLTKTDFGGANIADTYFLSANLEGAKLVNLQQYDAHTKWVRTRWWKADAIDAQLLKALLERSCQLVCKRFRRLSLSARSSCAQQFRP